MLGLYTSVPIQFSHPKNSSLGLSSASWVQIYHPGTNQFFSDWPLIWVSHSKLWRFIWQNWCKLPSQPSLFWGPWNVHVSFLFVLGGGWRKVISLLEDFQSARQKVGIDPADFGESGVCVEGSIFFGWGWNEGLQLHVFDGEKKSSEH